MMAVFLQLVLIVGLLACIAYCGGAIEGAVKLLRTKPPRHVRRWCLWVISGGIPLILAFVAGLWFAIDIFTAWER